MMSDFFTDDEIEEMNVLLAEDGYGSIEEWMEDSDYIYDENVEAWFDVSVGHPPVLNRDMPVDPYSQFYNAKEAEREFDG